MLFLEIDNNQIFQVIERLQSVAFREFDGLMHVF